MTYIQKQWQVYYRKYPGFDSRYDMSPRESVAKCRVTYLLQSVWSFNCIIEAQSRFSKTVYFTAAERVDNVIGVDA